MSSRQSITNKKSVLNYNVKKNQLLNIFLYKYKGKNFLVDFKNKTNFILVPDLINIKSEELSIKFSVDYEQHKAVFDNFVSSLKTFLFNNKIIYTKRIKIFGLGYKVFKEEKHLIFNLGYSQPLKILLPHYLNDIIIKKNILIIKSFDKIALGNFIHFITHLKKRDIYKGKGLSLEYQIKKLKTVKKK